MSRVYNEEQKQRRRDLQKKYRSTEEYRAKRRAYENSTRNNPEHRAKKKEYQDKYVTTEKYITRQKEKFVSPNGRAKLFYKTIKRRATSFQIEFNLTVEWLEERLIKGVCEVSGVPFELDTYGKGHDKFYSPSVDRIDNSKGYTIDNCRMVLFAFNAGKHTGSDSDFIKLIQGLIANGYCNDPREAGKK